MRNVFIIRLSSSSGVAMSSFDFRAFFQGKAPASSSALALTGRIMNRYANSKLFVSLTAKEEPADPAVVRLLSTRACDSSTLESLQSRDSEYKFLIP